MPPPAAAAGAPPISGDLQTLVRHIKVKRGRSGVALVGQTPRAPVAHRTSSNKCRHVFLVDTCRHLFGRRVFTNKCRHVTIFWCRPTSLVWLEHAPGQGLRTRAKRTTGKQGLRHIGSNWVKLGQTGSNWGKICQHLRGAGKFDPIFDRLGQSGAKLEMPKQRGAVAPGERPRWEMSTVYIARSPHTCMLRSTRRRANIYACRTRSLALASRRPRSRGRAQSSYEECAPDRNRAHN
jgi:hypothetical protein